MIASVHRNLPARDTDQGSRPLASHIVEAVLDGRQLDGVTLADAMAGVPVGWAQQIRN